jgi:hypothetical protein
VEKVSSTALIELLTILPPDYLQLNKANRQMADGNSNLMMVNSFFGRIPLSCNILTRSVQASSSFKAPCFRVAPRDPNVKSPLKGG